MVISLNQRVIFTDEADLSLSNIIQKYGLEENDADIIKRLKEKRSSPKTIIVKSVKNFVQGVISKEDLIILFQKELNIAQQSAEKLFEEIKEKLIPLVKKVSEEELEKIRKAEKIREESLIATPIKKPIGLEKIEGEVDKATLTIPPRMKNQHITEILSKNKEIKKSSKKSDIYREPID